MEFRLRDRSRDLRADRFERLRSVCNEQAAMTAGMGEGKDGPVRRSQPAVRLTELSGTAAAAPRVVDRHGTGFKGRPPRITLRRPRAEPPQPDWRRRSASRPSGD